MFELGQAVRLTQAVSYHDGGAGGIVAIELPEGATGKVTDLGDDLNPCLMVKFDVPFACLAEWDNMATFDNDADGDRGVGVAGEYLAEVERMIAKFDISFRDGSITHDQLADELERIAKMLREGYQQGEVWADSDRGLPGYHGWWNSTEASA